MTLTPAFRPAQLVRKKKGHEFEGRVVAEFETLDGEHKIVVESVVPRMRCLLFIFRPDQMEDAS